MRLYRGRGLKRFFYTNMADSMQRKANITHVIFDMDGLLLGKKSVTTLQIACFTMDLFIIWKVVNYKYEVI
jgi:hypothetical protein